MFIAAVARPRYDAQRKRNFYGKIGIWPFVTKEPAKRNSNSRVKGTMVKKTSNLLEKDFLPSSQSGQSDDEKSLKSLKTMQSLTVQMTIKRLA